MHLPPASLLSLKSSLLMTCAYCNWLWPFSVTVMISPEETVMGQNELGYLMGVLTRSGTWWQDSEALENTNTDKTHSSPVNVEAAVFFSHALTRLRATGFLFKCISVNSKKLDSTNWNSIQRVCGPRESLLVLCGLSCVGGPWLVGVFGFSVDL